MPSRPTVILFEPKSEDRELIRASLADVPDQQFTVLIGESAAQILGAAVIQDESTKCLIANAQTESLDVVALIRQTLEKRLKLPIIALLDSPETQRTVQLIKHGVVTVLDKPVSRDVLVEAVEEALAAAEMYVQAGIPVDETQQQIASLTPGQRQVLYLVVAGTANKVIASRLGVSVRTIENWRRRVFQVLNVSTVADLVRKVMHIPMDPSDVPEALTPAAPEPDPVPTLE